MNPSQLSIPSFTIPSLKIALFGPFDVRVHDTPVTSWHTRKGQWLLALLVLRQGRPVERAWLAGTLWPDSTEIQAAANLRLSLTQLRRTLGNVAHRLQSPSAHTLCLDLEGADVDLFAFDAAIASGDTAALEAAVALYRGPLLEGCSEEWALPERATREQSYLGALETLAAHATAGGDLGKASSYLQRVVAIDALRESAHRSLMQALADRGDYAAVTQVYRDLRLNLHRELNAFPAPETDAFYNTLKRQAHRPVALPSLPPPDTALPPRRLPAPLTRLIGRQQEVEDVVGWLGVGRLVTLTGAGGVGKTRLAIAAAEALWKTYADGIWFVELAPLSDPSLVTQAVATTLGVKEQPQRPILQTLTDALSSRTLLLVMDNCEHLLEACAALLDHLLGGCPSLNVLATSRQVLGLTGERIYRAPSLALPPLGETAVEKEAASLLEVASVELFVERAVLAHPGFRLTRRNAEAVSRICRRLDGIPLSLELAAARIRSLTVEEIDARLKGCFDLLSGGSRAALPRHRTLRALIDWSYDLLTGKEKTLLCRLSVFAGGWTLEAAEQVCSDFGFWILDFGLSSAPSGGATSGSDRELRHETCVRQQTPNETSAVQNPKSKIQNEEVLDLLIGLVDKSLVVAEAQDGTTRYRLLATIRQYAVERLADSGGSAVTHRQHMRFFLQFAEEAEQDSEQATWSDRSDRSGWSGWLDRLETEHDNLRAALDWCQTDEQEAEAGLRLAGALNGFWLSRGYRREGRVRLEAALANRCDAPSAVRAKALMHVGWIALEAGDSEAAHRHWEENLAISRTLHDRPGEAYALDCVGAALRDQGEWDAARPYFEAGLALFQELGNQGGVAWSLHCLGMIAHFQGDLVSARALYEEAVAKRTEQWNAHGTLMMLGRLLCDMGDYASAYTHYAQCLVLFEQTADTQGMATNIDQVAILAVAHGQSQRAAQLFGAADALRKPLDLPVMPLDRARVAEHLSAAQAALGDKAFAAAWAAGQAMTLEQAVSYALTQEPTAHGRQ